MTDDPRERAEQRTLLMPRAGHGLDLAPGQRRQEYLIQRTLGVGGYSIVYLAQDTRLDRQVALKEYMPSMLAVREPSGLVSPQLPRFEPLFDKGLVGFMNEAKLLGSFDHPGLVKVHRFWAEAGTAYMAMPYYEGVTLKRLLADMGVRPAESWLRALASQLMQALQALHTARCVHRNVSPDNVLMLPGSEQNPRPVLLDFSAARRVIGDATQTLTAILKSGYSPVEQYEAEQTGRQGAWTDVYSLSALLYTAAVGRAPGSSIARLMQDDLEPARVAARGQYSDAFLAAIDAGLTVRPEMRPQSLQAFQRLLDATAAPPLAGPRRAEAEVPKARGMSPAMGMLAAALAAVAVVLGVVVVAWALLR
jgi:serine/threonine protein kinase